MLQFYKFKIYNIKRILFFFLILFIFFSCSKPIPPVIQSVAFSNLKFNQDNDIETLLVIRVFNPNDSDFNITINELRVYKDNKVIVYINKEKTIKLEKNKVGFISTGVVFKKDNLLESIFTILANQKIEITLKGNLIYHHWINDFQIKFEKTFPLDLLKLIQ